MAVLLSLGGIFVHGEGRNIHAVERRGCEVLRHACADCATFTAQLCGHTAHRWRSRQTGCGVLRGPWLLPRQTNRGHCEGEAAILAHLRRLHRLVAVLLLEVVGRWCLLAAGLVGAPSSARDLKQRTRMRLVLV